MRDLKCFFDASELDELAHQLTAFNWNSFTEVLLATMAGALFAFGGTWFLQRRSRLTREDQQNRAAITEFMNWLGNSGLRARKLSDLRAHFEENHAEHVADSFPEKLEEVDQLSALVEIERLRLNSTGLIALLATIVRRAHSDDDGKDGEIAYVYWALLSDGASEVLQRNLKTKNQLLDWARAEEKRRKEKFKKRFDKCSYCAYKKEKAKLRKDIDDGVWPGVEASPEC